MAMMRVNGLNELIAAFGALSDLPTQVTDQMLVAGADVFKPVISRLAATMLSANPGTYYTGAVPEAVGVGTPGWSKGRKKRLLRLTFEGEQHGESLARIAYIQEYGTKRQAGRPFLQVAAETAADAVAGAEGEVYTAYLSKIGL